MFTAIIEAYDVGWEARRTASSFYIDMIVEDLEAIMTETGCGIMADDGDVGTIIDKFMSTNWVL